MRYQLATCAVLVLVLLPSAATATKYASPERHDVRSPNRKFVVDVDPGTKIHRIFESRDRKTPLWSFSRQVWHGPFFISNDGKVVAVVNWRFVGVNRVTAGETCFEFWNKEGCFKRYKYSELAPNPRRTGWFEVAPIGSDWRVWYDNAVQEDDSIRISTTDLYEYHIALDDGAITNRSLLWTNLLAKRWLWLSVLGAFSSLLFMWIWRRRRREAAHAIAGQWQAAEEDDPGPGRDSVAKGD